SSLPWNHAMSASPSRWPRCSWSRRGRATRSRSIEPSVARRPGGHILVAEDGNGGTAMNVVEMGEELHRREGDRPRSLVFEGREYSSGELRAMAMRMASVLRELGVGAGDRVAVMTPNCPEVGVTYGACWRIGAVTIPILFLLAPPA